MTNPIIPFDFQSHQIRFFTEADGIKVVAKDIALMLGHASAADFLKGCPTKYKGRKKVPTPGGDQELTVLSEPGLYFCLARSNKPQAQPFQDFVFEEVLPSISAVMQKKTGT